MTRKEIKEMLKEIIKKEDFEIVESLDGDNYLSCYLGSYMNLDPCGRYHHILSPNKVSKRCENFWANLEEIAEELDCWIESGEGDPTDIFLCKNEEKTNEKWDIL